MMIYSDIERVSDGDVIVVGSATGPGHEVGTVIETVVLGLATNSCYFVAR